MSNFIAKLIKQDFDNFLFLGGGADRAAESAKVRQHTGEGSSGRVRVKEDGRRGRRVATSPVGREVHVDPPSVVPRHEM